MARLHHLAPVLSIAPLALVLTVGSAAAQDSNVPEPSSFTSAFSIPISPDPVVDAMGQPAPGESGATGSYRLRVDRVSDVVCYDITISGVTEPFMSPARTATHLHQGPVGAQGPARIVFPNPQSGTSSGCQQVPTTVGLPAGGPDAGAAFTLAQLEADPTGFYADVHTMGNPAGALRGQVGRALPTGGVAAGGGGTAGLPVVTSAALVGLAGATLSGTMLAVRRRSRA